MVSKRKTLKIDIMKILKTIHVILLLVISHFNTAQDYPFTVDVKGTGQPILLFPGFTGSHSFYGD